jgi:hypothetical protein
MRDARRRRAAVKRAQNLLQALLKNKEGIESRLGTDIEINAHLEDLPHRVDVIDHLVSRLSKLLD